MIQKKVVHLGKIYTEGRVIRKAKYGYGEFSTKDFKVNDVIIHSSGELVPSDVAYYTYETEENLFVEDIPNSHYLNIEGQKYRYTDQMVNHSCNPNMLCCNTSDEYTYNLIALRDIKVGEELTTNYNLFFWDLDRISKHSFTCECGSDNCVGEILGFKFLSKDLQEKMIQYADKQLVKRYNEIVDKNY